MYHITMILIIASMSGLGWMLLQSAPRSLSLLLPTNLTFGLGACFFTFAVFNAFTSAFIFQKPEFLIESLILVIVGLWFMCAATAGQRGSANDNEMMKRLAAMLLLLMGLMVSMLYVNDPKVVSVLSLAMIGGGYWVSRDYLTGTRSR